MDRLDLYVSIVPNDRQLAVQKENFNVFIHYGMNTFAQKEWSDGTFPPSTFNPSAQDTDQWCEVIKSTGAAGVILTAKHHDGFCLWPTATTSYSVKNSPYKEGRGDVVRELSDSAKKYGLKFGVYLSPWDRNSEYYGTEKYNDFYCAQLTELLTGYGDIFCLWLDGACGAAMDGKPKQVYDFPRYYALARQLQPNCLLSNCAPEIRWVGNEGGYARESEWNVLPDFNVDTQTIQEKSQRAAGEKMNKPLDVMSADLGSRKVLDNYDSFMWYPAEVDVSIRPGWFYHKREDGKLRSLNNLLYIYYTSVGGNNLLLLNVPPDKRGLIHENDAKRLKELGDAVREGRANPVKIARFDAPSAEDGCAVENLAQDSGYYLPKEEASSYTIDLSFAAPTVIDKVKIVEDTRFSQRIESYEIYSMTGGLFKRVYSGTTVGFNRIALLRKPITAEGVRIIITSCRRRPHIESITVYQGGGIIPKPPTALRLRKWLHRLFNK